MTSASRLIDMARHLWRDLAHRSRAERELNEELCAYIELAVADRVRRGEAPADARRMVMASMRGTDHVKERVRDTRRTARVESLIRDVRYALRSFARNSGLTVVALLTLAIGVGGTTAVFTLVHATLLAPTAGVAAPDRLVTFDRLLNGNRYNNFAFPDFLDYRERTHSFATLAADIGTPVSAVVGGETVRLATDLVTADYFRLLGIHAATGRLLSAADAEADASPAVVIGYGLWQRAFGGSDRTVGTTMRLAGHRFTIVGVAPRGFQGTHPPTTFDVWAPVQAQPLLLSRMSADVLTSRSAGWLTVMGRLAPGVQLSAAAGDVHRVAAQLTQEFPVTNAGRGATLHAGVGLDPDDRASLARTMRVASLAVTLLLLIACANVAGLLMVRAAGRRHEMAARLALGASRRRLVQQLAVEGALLALGGAILGLGLAFVFVRLGVALAPANALPLTTPPGLDPRMVAVALAAATVSAALFSLAPALGAGRLQPIQAIRAGAPGAGGSGHGIQRMVVAAQVGLSFALLASAVTISAAVHRVLTAPPGFEPTGLVVRSLDLASMGLDEAHGLAVYERLMDRLDTDPALQSASFGKTVPPQDWSDRVSLFVPGTEPPRELLRGRELQIGRRIQLDHVAPGYFRTLGIPLQRGRAFTGRDTRAAPNVAIVNESFARSWWPNEDPIGKRVSWPSLDGPARPPLTVVGVVADHRYTALTTLAAPLIYVPVLQAYDGRTTIVARAAGDPGAALRAIAGAVHDVAPDVATYGAMTMQDRMAGSIGSQRALALWLAAFGALALLMAAVGLYGVIAQMVTHRRRELSVRMALGASVRRTVAGVVREAMWVAAAGLAGGAPLALAMGALMRGPLDGMNARTGDAWAVSAVLLTATVLAAAIVPARRAASTNPAEALRCE